MAVDEGRASWPRPLAAKGHEHPAGLRLSGGRVDPVGVGEGGPDVILPHAGDPEVVA